MFTLNIAEGFSFAIAPRKRNSCGALAFAVPGVALGGNWIYTAAAVSGGRVTFGRRKTTRCPKRGAAGNVNAKFVVGVFGSCWIGTMSVRQGRPGRTTENIVRNGWVESCAGLGVSRRMVFDEEEWEDGRI